MTTNNLIRAKMTGADSKKAIILRVFAVAFGLLAALSWVLPIVPSGDGPFQTLNWISRLKQGQLPGRDFDVFHGIGTLWVHALLAIPFDSARGVIWVHYLGSLVTQWMLWTVVFRSMNHPWRQSLTEGAALCGVMLLTMGIPFANVSQLVSAGHSMVGARVALPLLCLFLAHRWIRSDETTPWWRAGLIMGAAAGMGGWFATDQAPASLIMGMMTAASSTWSVSRGSIQGRLLRVGLTLLLVSTAAIVTYLLLLWITTGGTLDRCLGYWWTTLPQVQFWYFGGAPNAYFHRFSDLLDPSILILGFASLTLHLLGFAFRKSGQWPLRLGLATYGVVSLLPLMGMLFPHYFSGLWCTGLIGLLLAQWPNRMSARMQAMVSERIVGITLLTGCLILLARDIHVQWKHAARCQSPEQLPSSVLGGLPSGDVGEAVPGFVIAEYQSRPSPNLLRAFYRAAPEISLGQAGVGRFDYIIHALGDKQQSEYRQVLLASPPVFLRVPCQRNFLYTQWLWHQWPELWAGILSHYRLEDVYKGSAYWKRIDEPVMLKTEQVAVKLAWDKGVAVIRTERRPISGCLLHLTVTYRTEPISGPLAMLTDKMTRVTLRTSGVLDEQPFSLPPGRAPQVRQFYLIPNPDADPEVRLSAEGPIYSSSLVITDVVAEEVQGGDLVGLISTLKP